MFQLNVTFANWSDFNIISMNVAKDVYINCIEVLINVANNKDKIRLCIHITTLQSDMRVCPSVIVYQISHKKKKKTEFSEDFFFLCAFAYP